MIIRLLIFLGLSVLGYYMVRKPEIALSLIGRQPFAEKFFGGGGSILFYKLLGVFLIFVGFSAITGLYENIFAGLANFLPH